MSKWIQKAIEKKGSLHKALGVPEDEKIPTKKLEIKSTDSPKMKKRKILAQTLRGIAKKKATNEALTNAEMAVVILAESIIFSAKN